VKPSPEQLARLKAYYEAKIFGEVEINAVKKKVKQLGQPGPAYLFSVLDARPRDAFLAGHIPGALSVPLDQAAEVVKVLPPERQYVTYCWGHT
jgi:3-mercaptopyruvate sulfurtransferase SseA